MSLKANSDGTYTISSLGKLREAAKLRQALFQELEELDVHTIQAEITELSRAMATYMAAAGLQELPNIETGEDEKFKAVLVQRSSLEYRIEPDAGRDSEIAGPSLKETLPKGVFLKVTKRVIDRDALDEAIRDGTVDEDEVRECAYERKQAPFVRFYPQRSDDADE